LHKIKHSSFRQAWQQKYIFFVLLLIKRSYSKIFAPGIRWKKTPLRKKNFLKGKRLIKKYKTSKKVLTVGKTHTQKRFFVVFTHGLWPWCFIRRMKSGEHGGFIFLVFIFISSSWENDFCSGFLNSMQERNMSSFCFCPSSMTKKKQFFVLRQIYQPNPGCR